VRPVGLRRRTELGDQGAQLIAAAMALFSLSVVGNANRLRRHQPFPLMVP
jgi:hypothetical protein